MKTVKELKDAQEKKLPRKQIIKVTFDVMIPRSADPKDGVDVVTSENMIGITDGTLPSKIMAKLKPQLIDTLAKAREHTPSVLFTPTKSKLILPGDV